MRRLLTSSLAILMLLAAGAPLASAQPAGGGGLSMSKIEALLNLKTPDATVAGEITRRGLAFTPDAKTLERLKALGAGPLTVSAVEALRPLLEDARKQIPELLKELYSSLDGGDLQRARPLLSANLGADATKRDSICKPFSYRGHYVEGFVERPGRTVEVRVRLVSRPLEEAAYVLVLRASAGRWQVQDVLPPPNDWFAPLVTSAQDLGHKFVYALKAGRQDVLGQTVSGVELALMFRGRCGEAVRSMGDVAREGGLGVRDLKGLKGVATVTLQRGVEWRFFVEPVGDEPKIVRIETNLRGCENLAEEGPGLESRTLARFGLAAEAAAAPAAAAAPSSGFDARVQASLLDEALAALRAGDEASAYRRWDEILEAGGTVTVPACREGSGLGRCSQGRLSVSAAELKFVDEAGTALLTIKPGEVTKPEYEKSKIALTKKSVGRLKLRVGEKNQNFNYVPQAGGDCEPGKFYGCLDGSPALAQQSAVARYLARAIVRLATGGAGSPSTPQAQASMSSTGSNPSGAQGPVGVWVGEVNQPGYGSYEMRVVLPAQGSGGRGLVRYPSLGCDGSLEVLEAGPARVVLKETIERGKDKCATGLTIEGEPQADGALKLRFVMPDGKVVGSATLTKR